MIWHSYIVYIKVLYVEPLVQVRFTESKREKTKQASVICKQLDQLYHFPPTFKEDKPFGTNHQESCYNLNVFIVSLPNQQFS